MTDLSKLEELAKAAPSVATVDTPEFQQLAEYWRKEPCGSRSFETAWNELIAHIDAHVAAQVAAKDAEIKTLKAALDAQGELTDRYQEITLSAQAAAPVVEIPECLTAGIPRETENLGEKIMEALTASGALVGLTFFHIPRDEVGQHVEALREGLGAAYEVWKQTQQPSPAPVAMTDEQRKLVESCINLRGLYHNTHCNPDGFRLEVEALAERARAILAAQHEAK